MRPFLLCSTNPILYNDAMRRSFVVIMLVVSAFWHVLTVGGWLGVSSPRETAHTMLHWQGQAHHHHGDGSVTQDSSEESTQHLTLDGVLAVNGAWSASAVLLHSFELAGPVVKDDIVGPWPYLDGLRRPPKYAS